MAIDWTDSYKKYQGRWVALLDDEKTVVGQGQTVREAIGEAKKKGHNDPILMRVPAQIIPYIGGFGT